MTENVITYVEDDVDTSPRKKTKPPQRWRNQYVAVVAGARCTSCGLVRNVNPGEKFLSHCSIWPSYDIAMTKGLEFQPYTVHHFDKPVACDE